MEVPSSTLRLDGELGASAESGLRRRVGVNGTELLHALGRNGNDWPKGREPGRDVGHLDAVEKNRVLIDLGAMHEAKTVRSGLREQKIGHLPRAARQPLKHAAAHLRLYRGISGFEWFG